MCDEIQWVFREWIVYLPTEKIHRNKRLDDVVRESQRFLVVATSSIRGRRGQGPTTPRAIQRRAPAFAGAPGDEIIDAGAGGAAAVFSGILG